MLTASTPTFLIGTLALLGGGGGQVARLSNGTFAVVWSNNALYATATPGVTDGDGTFIAARILDADGSPLGEAVQVNTTTAGFQGDPQVLALTNGNVLVSWTHGPGLTDFDVEAKAQILNPTGAKVGAEIAINAANPEDQDNVRLAALPGGGFLATWLDHRNGFDNATYAQKFDATGAKLGAEMLVLDAELDVHVNDFLQLPDGTFRIFYDTIYASDGSRVNVGGVDRMALTALGELPVPFRTSHASVRMAAMENGLYAVAGYNDDDNSVIVSIFDARHGDAQVGSSAFVTVSEAPNVVGGNPKIAVLGLADGGIAVAWTRSTDGGGTAEYDVVMQTLNREGGLVGGNVVVHSAVSGIQTNPFLSQAEDGRILVGWDSNVPDLGGKPADIYGRFFTSTGTGGTGNPGSTDTPTQGDDTLTGTAGADTIDGLGGNDRIELRQGPDNGTGGDGNDTLLGQAGYDTLYGAAGHDSLSGGLGFDWLFGGDGNDTLRGDAGSDHLIGNAGLDLVDGGDGNDTLNGGEDDDVLYGGAGNDWLSGDQGNDTLYGGGGADTLYGFDGDDSIVGGDGADAAWMGLGNDVFEDNTQEAPANNDTVHGEAGDDTIWGGNGFDEFFGEAGNDYIRGGKGFDLVDGGDGDDTLDGNDGNDTVTGGRGSDYAILGTGADIWTDGADDATGHDRVFGGGGWDTMTSIAGNDTLTGGAGRDTFVFLQGTGAHLVTDYVVGEDRLSFQNILWNGPLSQEYLDAVATVTADGLVLVLDSDSSVTLAGVHSTAGLLADISLTV